MTASAFRRLALSMPGAHEEPHFQRTSFRMGRRIFATMAADGREAMVPVHPVERCLALLASDPATYVDYGGWTRRNGSLGLRLERVDAALVRRLVRGAWERIAATSMTAGRRPRDARR